MADLPSELDRRQELEDRWLHLKRTADIFRQFPGEWLQQMTFKKRGCGDAIRTRVSQCRKLLGMHIESRPTSYLGADGKKHRGFQEYRYLPHQPLGRDASEYRTQQGLF